jgi:5-methylcytosine-specific restriction endonuclease McrA
MLYQEPSHAPSRPSGVTPRGLYSLERRRDQADFHNRVYIAYAGRCRYCRRRSSQLLGTYPDLKMMIADHIMPLGRGGSNETKNGQLFCFFCNLKFGWRARYRQSRGADNPLEGMTE